MWGRMWNFCGACFEIINFHIDSVPSFWKCAFTFKESRDLQKWVIKKLSPCLNHNQDHWRNINNFWTGKNMYSEYCVALDCIYGWSIGVKIEALYKLLRLCWSFGESWHCRVIIRGLSSVGSLHSCSPTLLIIITFEADMPDEIG